ncbi:MAG TPA: DoxX family membrane protein [Saprospiraceae bacterium]|nr:DoxX family membrane protein [Saprospiraceae bacterium]HNG88616.1 DoxX family membrane protein [Saprospiraceae bacterium]
MNAFLSLGRWFFAVPFAVFGLFHFMGAEAMAEAAIPAYMPAKIIWVYLTGAGLVAASVAMLTGKYDKLAAVLLAVFLIIMVLLIHSQVAMMSADPRTSQMGLSNLLKDISLAGGALMYAKHYATDSSVIG